MKFDLHTRETLVLIAGLLGLLEQEAVRLFLSLDPSSALSGIFGSMVLGSIGVGALRTAVDTRKNEDERSDEE